MLPSYGTISCHDANELFKPQFFQEGTWNAIKFFFVKKCLADLHDGSSQGVQLVKNTPADPGDPRDVGSIPGLGRSPGIRVDNPLQYLAWKSPWTVEPGGLQSMDFQRARQDWALMHAISCMLLSYVPTRQKICNHTVFFWRGFGFTIPFFLCCLW